MILSYTSDSEIYIVQNWEKQKSCDMIWSKPQRKMGENVRLSSIVTAGKIGTVSAI